MRETGRGTERAQTRNPSGEPKRTDAPAARNRTGAARLIGLQRTAGNRAVAGVLAPRAPATGPLAIQRVAAQLGVAADGVTIDSLSIRGRPKSPYKGTMGDHTTAYIVQVTAVRDAIVGKAIPQAVAAVQALVARSLALPGVARSAKLPSAAATDHGSRLDEARTLMENLADALGKLDLAGRAMGVAASAKGAAAAARGAAATDPGLEAAARAAEAQANAAARAAMVAATDVSDAGAAVDDPGGGSGPGFDPGAIGDVDPAAFAAAQAAVAAEDARAMTLLQRLVTAYLEYRELIPLSTLNIASVSTGLAGRGKGEAGHAAVLAQYRTLPAPTVKAAIVGLLDAAGVAILETRTKAEARLVAPGVKRSDRVNPILLQHLHAIETTYPGALLHVWPDQASAMVGLREVVDPLIDAERKKNVEIYNKALAAKHEELYWLNAARVVTARRTTTVAPDDPRVRLRTEIADLAELVTDNLGTPVAPVDYSGKRARTQTVRTNIGEEKKRKRGEPEADPLRDAAAEEARLRAEARALAKLEASMQGAGDPTATQLVVEGGRIVDIIFEGRPPSPFDSGRMGAHTSAWLVHKDVIGTALKGRTPDEAVALLPGLGTGVDELAHRLGDFRTGHENPSTRALMKPVMDDVVVQAAASPPHVKPLLIQSAISRLLTHINMLPGVAMDSVNTGGDSEGKHRKVILAKEKGTPITPDALQRALLGLLDLREVDSRESKATLAENHMKLIQRAYPRSYAASGFGGMNTEQILRLHKSQSAAKNRRTA